MVSAGLATIGFGSASESALAAGGPVLRGLTKIKVAVAKTAVRVTL